MSCPKCGGYTLFNDSPDDETDDIIAITYAESWHGLWVYRHSYCEDCDWKGITRQLYHSDGESGDYEDDVELPKKGENIFFVKEE